MVVFKRILVPIDFGGPSTYALDVAVALAKQHEASLTIIHAWDIPAYAYAGYGMAPMDILTPLEQTARQLLDEAVARVAKEFSGATAVLRKGVAWREILAATEETKADLVVMGTHGREGIGRVVLGSVAEKTVRHSPVTVLVTRQPVVA